MYKKGRNPECSCTTRRASLPGLRMAHPLAGTARLTAEQIASVDGLSVGMFVVLMTKNKCCLHKCLGHMGCDFSYATMLFFRPGDTISIDADIHAEEACVVAFKSELACSTDLHERLDGYTFFGYATDEALHISEREQLMLGRQFDNLAAELDTYIDTHSPHIISRRIDLMLEYCARFYNRQFIMREDCLRKTMRLANHAIHDFFALGCGRADDTPTADYIARRTGTSEAYLEDIVKCQTGLSVSKYAELRRLDMARDMLMHSHKTDAEIAAMLNYGTANRFRLFFSRTTGMTTDQCRTSC